MESTYLSLVKECEAALLPLTEEKEILTLSEQNVCLIRDYLQKLRQLVREKGFANPQQEQRFFKEIKPRLVSHGIYGIRLFELTYSYPKSSPKKQEEYLHRRIEGFQAFFKDYQEFYHYYCRGASVLDEYYFVRGNKEVFLHDPFVIYQDLYFSTSYDGVVAHFMAYERLIDYLQDQINRGGPTVPEKTKNFSSLTWTAKKVDLVELIYALHTGEVFNHGQADLKQIVRLLERSFHIELGEVYRSFLEIRARKIENTKFLNFLKKVLAQRMYEADE